MNFDTRDVIILVTTTLCRFLAGIYSCPYLPQSKSIQFVLFWWVSATVSNGSIFKRKSHESPKTKAMNNGEPREKQNCNSKW